jgi:ABC-type amino acid transport system permease subunit
VLHEGSWDALGRVRGGVAAAVDVIRAVVVHVIIAEICKRRNARTGEAQAMPADAAVHAVVGLSVALHQWVVAVGSAGEADRAVVPSHICGVPEVIAAVVQQQFYTSR